MKSNIQLLLTGMLAIFLAGMPSMLAQAHPDHAEGAAGHSATDYRIHGESPDYVAPKPDDEGYYWWKGNLHTHTLWSDGDQFPEVVVEWYKRHGYHFLALSDHNILSEGEKWVNPATSRFSQSGGGFKTYEYYLQQFGMDWVESRTTEEGQVEVRLKPLNEFRTFFEEPGRFLMMQGEEITDHQSLHMNATNLVHLIPPQGGDTIQETIERNIDAVLEQQEETGQPILPHLNHPNFQWAVTAEDMAPVEKLRFFEVYNGHRSVRNYGDDQRAGLDRMWDIVLTKRLGELDLGVVYGLATDDAHNYDDSITNTALPGRGWVMIRSQFLTPEHLIAALRAGEFYATTGVMIRDINYSDEELAIEIIPKGGVMYTTQFIGTREGYDPSSEPVLDEAGEPINTTRRYSDDVGEVLHEETGLSPSYTLKGDEIYVRALVTSSKPKENYFAPGEHEMAWVQPLVPGK